MSEEAVVGETLYNWIIVWWKINFDMNFEEIIRENYVLDGKRQYKTHRAKDHKE